MAQGDVKIFAAAKLNLGNGNIDLSGGTLRLALITSATTPTTAAADPRWGAGGTVNFSTFQVSASGGYATGGLTISSPTWTLSAAKVKFDGVNLTWTQNVSSPTNARWGIGYQDDANDYAVFYVDLGADRDLTAGDLVVNWSSEGIFTGT